MIGLDTNVIVGWIVQRKKPALPRGDTYRVSHVAMAELIWVLGRRFGYSKANQIEVLKELLSASDVEVDRSDVVRDAVADFEAGGAEFSDFMIARDNQAAGCATTFTLDRDAARKPGFTLLRS